MAIQSTDVAILVARSGAARCGAFRCGFVPKFTSNESGSAPGPFYAWAERKQDADGTTWSTVRSEDLP